MSIRANPRPNKIKFNCVSIAVNGQRNPLKVVFEEIETETVRIRFPFTMPSCTVLPVLMKPEHLLWIDQSTHNDPGIKLTIKQQC